MFFIILCGNYIKFFFLFPNFNNINNIFNFYFCFFRLFLSTQIEVSRMGKIRKKWSDAELEKALVDIRSRKSTRSISILSGIPKSTLIAKLKGHRPIGKKTGPPTILSTEEEAIIVHWMLYLSKRGFPVTKTQLLNNVAYLIKQLDRETPFAKMESLDVTGTKRFYVDIRKFRFV